MLKASQLKENDTFYRVVPAFDGTLDAGIVFVVTKCLFKQEWKSDFEESMMFLKKEDAQAQADKMNKPLGESDDVIVRPTDLKSKE